MCNTIDSVDHALAGFGEAGLPAGGWAYLAAEAVRGLNHATLAPGAYPYPGDIYCVIGELLALAQRLPQAFNQAASALEGMDAAGHVRDVTDPDHTGPTAAEVRAGLHTAARVAATLAGHLTLAHNAAGRLAYVDTPTDGTDGAGER
jgi:hypothetical protein